jgi:Flp pilus assembly protein TadB
VNPNAGWYRDATGRAWSRYWDGDRWRDWIDGSDAREDPLGDRELEPPDADAQRLTLRAAQPSDVRRQQSTVQTGCVLSALWVLAGAWALLAVVVATVYGDSVWVVLRLMAIGFALPVLVTVLVIAARRRRR